MKTHATMFTTLFTLSLLAPGGCGDPCLPTFSADTLIIAPAEECLPVDSTGVGPWTTGAVESTGGGIESTGVGPWTTGDGECIPPVAEAVPFCAGVPEAGEAWGPCINGTDCTEGECKTTALGNVCLNECDGIECVCKTPKCFGGSCDDGACIPACKDSTPCGPLGMVCDADAGHCVYPNVNPPAPACQPPVGTAWAPCAGWGCDDGLVCVHNNYASICAPDFNSVGGLCPVDLCMPTFPQIVTIDAETIVCGNPCNDDAQCHSGQVCGKSKTQSICVWPD